MESDEGWATITTSSLALQGDRVGEELLLDNPITNRRSTRADLSAFRFPPSPPPPTSAGRFRSRRHAHHPSMPSPHLDGRLPSDFSNMEDRTPRSSLEFSQLRQQLDQLETPVTSTESRNIPFSECNVLFLVNGGSPLHRGFKNFAHQLLLNRRSPATPAVTRMIFWNETFNQYIVQEITVADGNLTLCVADVGSVRDFPRLLPIQREADLIIIFTTRSSAALSQRSLLGLERFTSDELQTVPHVLVMVNESSNKPSPRDAFASAHHFTNLEHVAVLYQSTSGRDSLGPCQIIHIDGCLQTLRPRGKFNGRSINSLVEWRDLPELDLAAALQRLELTRNPAASTQTVTVPRSPAADIATDRARGRGRIPWELQASRGPQAELDTADSRAANRVRRISQLLSSPTGDRTALSRLQLELRTEHRRNSRQFLDSPIYSRPQSLQPQSSINNALLTLVPEEPASPTSESFRGECQLCCEEDSQLVFLLKQSADCSSVCNSTIPWPFAVGAFPENDIISAFMCCDNCSFYVLEQGNTPIRETATGAFSLIPYTSNVERWADDLCKGFGHYRNFSRQLLPLVFLAVVEETLGTKSWARLDGSEENEQRHNALLWTRNKILTQVHINGDGHEGFVGEWIKKIVAEPKRNKDSMVWQYPLLGFRLMLRLTEAPLETRAKVMWKRLLIEITRHMRGMLESKGFEPVAGLVLGINEMLVGDEIKEVMNVLRPLEEEMAWIRKHARYAMVMWLSWMPGLSGLAGTTGEVVEALVEEKCGDVVMMVPEEVGKGWCANL
ncbi:hypothetical protein K440DRAFT_211961 [Wilcoxina mikolae CBS 423.85]|nr:hypothetical protein K440DRAFT_211961 [Wilcoxina mikolae CBS 423.85]